MATPGQRLDGSRRESSRRTRQNRDTPGAGTERLVLPAEDGSAPAFRRTLTRLFERCEVDSAASADFVLAASEAFSNALRHGRATPGDTIEAGLSVEPEMCRLTLEYPGDPFPVKPPRLPTATATHGRGRYLMSILVDEVQYEFKAGRTRVSLVKYWE